MTTIKIDEMRSIEIIAEDCWEISRGVFYNVTIGEKFVTENFSIGSTIENISDLKFTPIYSPNREFVAISEASNPEVILMFYDFSDGKHWPGGYERECFDSMEEFYNKIDEALDKLREHYPLRRFVLSHNDASDRKI